LASTALWSYGYGGYVDFELEGSRFAPSFRLGIARQDASTRDTVGATLRWSVARASACPWRFELAGHALSVKPCIGIDAGVLDATPVGLVASQASRRPWLAPWPAVRQVWDSGAVFFVEAEVALAVPLYRDEFAADPQRPLYRAPVLIPHAGLSIGARFP
jgi:hypothetical protein